MINYFVSLAGGSISNKETLYYPAFGKENVIKTEVYKCRDIEIRNSEGANIIHGCINEYPAFVWNDFFSKYKKQNGVSVLIK